MYVDAFPLSYGDPQTVQVTARRSLGAVTLRWRVGGGPVQNAATTEWNGGERFGGPGDVYYRVLRGNVTGTSPGDNVTVWFEGGGQTSDSFSYTAKVESSARVLVMAAEDYTGIWYTGDDVITRDRGMVPGTASGLANEETLQIRQYLNEGGRLFYTGKYAGYEYAFGYEYDPAANRPCDPNDEGQDGCIALSDNLLQYYLGAYIYNDDAGTKANGQIYDVSGVDTPFTGSGWSIGGPSANNQDHSA